VARWNEYTKEPQQNYLKNKYKNERLLNLVERMRLFELLKSKDRHNKAIHLAEAMTSVIVLM